jgi:hypothetical protein
MLIRLYTQNEKLSISCRKRKLDVVCSLWFVVKSLQNLSAEICGENGPDASTNFLM